MKIKKVIDDFKAFAIKGNMIDMAVGIIIGGAFGKIITDLKITLKEAVIEAGNVVTPEVTLNYGNFLQVVFDFLIVAFAIFCFVRLLAKLQKKKEEAPAPAPAAPSKEEQLLTEIRDLLKERNEK